jgi:hypothetical protein
MKDSYTSENMMDDLQFRRSIYADPSSIDEDILAAQNADPAKKKLAQELCQFDQIIKQAMNVPVPDDLCNKLLLRQTLKSHQQHKRKKRVHMALAASVAIIAGILVNYLQFSDSYSYDNVGDYALAHVYHEQAYFSNDADTNVSLDSLNKKMTTFNGSFNESMGELIAVNYCRFDGMKSLHLVFKGVTGTVAVFVVPKKEHLDYIEKFSDSNLQGEALSFEQNDIIVVANKKESLSQWHNAINNNITWSI